MKPKSILIIAVLLGIVTSGLVYGYVAGMSRPPQEERKVAVVVASATLQPRSVITPGSVRVVEVPISSIHPDALIRLPEAEGRIVRESIVAGEQVLRNRLYGLNEQPGLTFLIPLGKRAVSVAVNEVIGVAGFVSPKDRVDVLATFDRSFSGQDLTTTILQDVEVLAIAQEMDSDPSSARVTTTVTLAVSLDEAERLTLAEERGTLRLVLRPALYADNQRTSAVTAADILPSSVAGYLGGAGNVSGSAPADAARQQLQGSSAPSGTSPTTAAATASKPRVEVEVIRGSRRETETLQ